MTKRGVNRLGSHFGAHLMNGWLVITLQQIEILTTERTTHSTRSPQNGVLISIQDKRHLVGD